MYGLRGLLVLVLPLVALSTPASAEEATLLILHTNDLHDHIRPGYEGIGGMPYVAGYIKQVRRERRDVLLLDAGDVSEKGDMVADKTDSAIMYEAMGRIGYDAIAPGNHDLDHGVARVREWAAMAKGAAMLCLNYAERGGAACFPASKIFEVGGVKVGVIGMTVFNDKEEAEFDRTAALLKDEAARLQPDTHLLVVVCHLGSKVCTRLSKAAPAIQVFVSGHTHELIRHPLVVEETGALIVQTGQYAEQVGRIELTLDRDARKIVQAAGSLVEMRHDAVPCDTGMLEWVKQTEATLCPEAAVVVGWCGERLNASEAGVYSAAALRWHARADAAFCHTGRIIRAGLPKGDIDVNALFRTGGQRGAALVEAEMTGRTINDYLNYIHGRQKEHTEWSGFKGDIEVSADARSVKTDLDPARNYRVVMPELEWTSRFVKYLEENNLTGSIQPVRCPFTFIDALRAYTEYLGKENVTIDVHVGKLITERRLVAVPAR